MKLHSVIFYLTLTTLFYGCRAKSTFSNRKGSCVLKVYPDSTYSFTFPRLFDSRETESGIYRIDDSTITLLRKSFDKIDSVDIGYTCWEDAPDTLMLTLRDLYKNALRAKITLNNSDKEFETDSMGYLFISYSELERMNIVGSGEMIAKYRIVYEDKVFIPDMQPYNDSRKPDRIDFTLNQFAGEPFAILKRKYLIRNDTIFATDISRKVVGDDFKLSGSW